MKLAEDARNQNKHINLVNFENDPEILRMAAQVSDVLPYVPHNAIVANLSKSSMLFFHVLYNLPYFRNIYNNR